MTAEHLGFKVGSRYKVKRNLAGTNPDPWQERRRGQVGVLGSIDPSDSDLMFGLEFADGYATWFSFQQLEKDPDDLGEGVKRYAKSDGAEVTVVGVHPDRQGSGDDVIVFETKEDTLTNRRVYFTRNYLPEPPVTAWRTGYWRGDYSHHIYEAEYVSPVDGSAVLRRVEANGQRKELVLVEASGVGDWSWMGESLEEEST